MFGLFKKKDNSSENIILSPCKGEVVPIEKVPDQVFAELMMGDGIAINPMEGKLYSPVDGEVVQIFDTKHAIVVKSKSDINILMHVGLDTVSLEGVPFDVKVATGQKISKGDLIMNINLDYIKSKGLKTITPIIIMNDPDSSQKIVEHRTLEKEVFVNDYLMKIK